MKAPSPSSGFFWASLIVHPSADAPCHTIAVRGPVDFFRLSLTFTVSRKDADTRADGYTGSRPTGSNSTDKSTEQTATNDLALSARISRVIARKGVTGS
jgi:hypothetical protein